MDKNSWQTDALHDFKCEVGGIFERYAAIYGIENGPYGQQYLDNLKGLRELYFSDGRIKEGDFVEWKPGLKNKKRPSYYQPGIVMEVLAEPVLDKREEASSAYFRERLDVIIGFIDDDGDFITYYFDSSRFMPLRSRIKGDERQGGVGDVC